jgi:large subunit ribosomal protein L11
MTIIKAIVQGGKATPAPPLGPSLSAIKADVGEVINAINQKTKEFDGMEVPVTINIDPKTKKIDVSVGTPSVAALIKKELNVKALAKAPFNVYQKDEIKEEFKESLKFEQVVKIAREKMEDIKTDDLKKAVKQVVAFCVSAGVFIEDKKPKEIIKEIDEGKWDEKIK